MTAVLGAGVCLLPSSSSRGVPGDASRAHRFALRSPPASQDSCKGVSAQQTDGCRRFSSGSASPWVLRRCTTAGGCPAVSLEMAGGDFDPSSSVDSVNTIKIIKFTRMEMRATEREADDGANPRK